MGPSGDRDQDPGRGHDRGRRRRVAAVHPGGRDRGSEELWEQEELPRLPAPGVCHLLCFLSHAKGTLM